MNESTRQEYEQLYLTQFDRLARKTGRELGNYMDGEEAVSIAFVQLWEVLQREDVENMDALFKTILSRRTVDVIRGRKDAPTGLSPCVSGEEGDEDDVEAEPMWALVPEPTFETVRFRRDFDAALRALDAPKRDAFITQELRGLTVREAAEVNHLPTMTQADRCEAARTFIREEITR